MFQAEKERITDAANKKRAEAMEGNDNAAKTKNSTGTDSTTTVSDKKPADNHKTRAAKAKASKTDMGAVARMDALKKIAPDLAEQVRGYRREDDMEHRLEQQSKGA